MKQVVKALEKAEVLTFEPKESEKKIESINITWEKLFFTQGEADGVFLGKRFEEILRKSKIYRENWENLKKWNYYIWEELSKAPKFEYGKDPVSQLLLKEAFPIVLPFPDEVTQDLRKGLLLRKIYIAYGDTSGITNERYVLIEEFWTHKYLNCSAHSLSVYKQTRKREEAVKKEDENQKRERRAKLPNRHTHL